MLQCRVNECVRHGVRWPLLTSRGAGPPRSCAGACSGSVQRELGDDSGLRSKMQAFIDAVAPKLQLHRIHRGDRPSMKAASLRRRNDVNGREPLLSLRKAAYDRLVELLEMGWPSLSRAERWHRGPLGRQLRSGRSNIYIYRDVFTRRKPLCIHCISCM